MNAWVLMFAMRSMQSIGVVIIQVLLAEQTDDHAVMFAGYMSLKTFSTFESSLAAGTCEVDSERSTESVAALLNLCVEDIGGDGDSVILVNFGSCDVLAIGGEISQLFNRLVLFKLSL